MQKNMAKWGIPEKSIKNVAPPPKWAMPKGNKIFLIMGLPFLPMSVYWWWTGGPSEAQPRNGRAELGSSMWAKADMRLIPFKCPPEPFEPGPSHNQTMLMNMTLMSIFQPTC